MKLVSSNNSEMLIVQYKKCLQNAEASYFYDASMRQAAYWLRKAFDLSLVILGKTNASREGIQRLLDVSILCFAYCPVSDTDDHYFPEMASDRLAKIISSVEFYDLDPETQADALAAYQRIAKIASHLTNHQQSLRAKKVLDCFNQVRLAM